jgi:uncharacterized membrane protein YesL
MSLFGGYDQPGRGIPKAPAEKKGFFKFMEIYGRRGWKLVQLNLIYLLALLPVVTFGPATAAMTKICRNWSQERNAFVWADFWEAYKKNFKQSFVMGLVDLVFIVGFSVAIPTYSSWAKQSNMMYVPLIICLSCCIVFFMMHFYIYLMIVSTNLTLGKILKNSFFLVSLGIKNSLWTLIVWIVVAFFVVGFPMISLFIIPFWPFSFICFVNSFNCYPVIRKYVIQPYYDARGEDNPEFDYLKTDESIFEDKGAEEHIAEKKAKNVKKNKPKTIS